MALREVQGCSDDECVTVSDIVESISTTATTSDVAMVTNEEGEHDAADESVSG
jgi:hypothetical protein